MLQIVKIPIDHAHFAHVRAIRKKVFVEEQKVSVVDEYDIYEETSTHYLLNNNGVPLAVARSRKTKEGIKLERFAVLAEFRGQGFGKKIVKEVINEVQGDSDKIYLHAQLPVIAFYNKLGFQKEGDVFVEANIEHYKMVFKPQRSN